ncbi:alpha/beta hydrolase [Paenibacillus rigui]|uniref:Alpha/beta hydrolase n=1 Tax=Paenibacillus rigui TaxID=554312 RepID=A0A229UG48_9BACL|nr:alpha/beta hydrolase [Paenibacillus rigui]OXM82357.1 alpha/beta hydrolase [Paenibacillus rigui]
MKWTRARMMWCILLAALIGFGVAAAIYLKPYKPQQAAIEAMKAGNGVTVTEHARWIRFEPAGVKATGIIFYPGGLVEPESYAPLALLLAKQGYRTWIVKMPLNLAVSSINRAEEIMNGHPDVSYVIGGHSLGGAIAGRFAAAHADRLVGVFFLGAYTDAAGSLTQTKLAALTITGSEDGIVNRVKLEQGKAYLPSQSEQAVLEGGNHAQFGSYGVQKGDRPASLSPEQQQELTAQRVTNWLIRIAQRK